MVVIRRGNVNLLNGECSIRHCEPIMRPDGSRIDSLTEITSLDRDWDALECESGVIAIYKLDPMVLAISYSQQIGNRYRNFT